ncbi:MAG: ABC transporter permease [Candidatus Tectomicrobia bacterium]|nr:ABC transporter permease [Candidatus Tectomicrobia bacterium]
MVKALDRKLLRDLWRLKGQAASIAFVIASGIALLVMSLSTHEALRVTAEAYYDRYRFGHVFATVKRTPLHLEDRIKALDGVQSVQLRISMQAILDLNDFAEPLMGRLISIPEGQQPVLNQLVLRSGRLVEPGRPDEVVINESFAKAHGLTPGDTIDAIINDTKRELQIVGTAMSPEFIYVLSPFALLPDKKRYGILWMGRKALEAAYDYDGAFNDLSLTVLRGTDTRQTVQALDTLLAPYGSIGAIDRKDHLSNWFVQNELKQHQTTARILPTIFLLVAAFLTNTVLTRLITTERSDIGLMKAFGYSNVQVGWHYAKLVMAITALGIVLGWGLGAVLGRVSIETYTETLNFPLLIYRPGPSAFVMGAIVSLSVGLLATARAVRGAARLPPVVAMRPPAPPMFRRKAEESSRLATWLDEPTRIIFRQIARWPRRAAVTVLGFAGAIAMMVLSLQFIDALNEMARSHFSELQREDLALGFSDPKSSIILNEIERLPGIMSTEPMRIVSADLVFEHRTHRGTVQGIAKDAQLTRIFDVWRGPLPVPAGGITLTARLAEKLRVGIGDDLSVQVLEGRRPTITIPVAEIYDSYIGMIAYMELGTLNRLLGDRPVTQYVNALIDESRRAELLTELKNLPAVSTVALKSVAIKHFHDTVAALMMIFIGFFSAFSFALGFGVTYNAQRIALSERGRELATLRVLGFSRGDALYILLGETMLLVAMALPVGCLLGWGLTALFVNASGFQTELMRFPLAIQPATYGLSVVVMLAASAVSGIAMKRRVDHLDLVAVLKTRE